MSNIFVTDGSWGTPSEWYRQIVDGNGKCDLLAVLMMSFIVSHYYKSTDAECESQKLVFDQVVTASRLYRISNKELADHFCLTPRQISPRLKLLSELGFIKVHHVDILDRGRVFANEQFIQLLLWNEDCISVDFGYPVIPKRDTDRITSLGNASNWTCAYCRQKVRPSSLSFLGDKLMATIDHKIPVSKGGLDTEENTVLSCFGCNTSKGAHTSYEDFCKASNDRLNAKSPLAGNWRGK